MKKGQRPRRHIRFIQTACGAKYIIVNGEVTKIEPVRLLKKDLKPQYRIMRKISRIGVPHLKPAYRKEIRLRQPHLSQKIIYQTRRERR